MRVTDEMCEAFRRAWNGTDDCTRAGLQAVFDLIEREPGIVMVSKVLFDSMKQDVVTLRQLEAGGVDNWEGYGAAMAGLGTDRDR